MANTNVNENTTSKRKDLSFVRNAHKKDADYFVVPDGHWATGYEHGITAFADLLNTLRCNKMNGVDNLHIPLRQIIQQVTHLASDIKGLEARTSAASQFIYLMREALEFMATQAKFEPWLARRLADAQQQALISQRHEAEEKAAFVARMKAAKAAKAAKRELAEA